MTVPYENYQIFFTPLVRPGVYGSSLNVTQDINMTDFIARSGLQNIVREIDNGDYDFGIFTFGDLTIKAINYTRKFNNEHDCLSIFPFTRDLCKVEIRLYDPDGNYTVRFRGLIDEQATRHDIEKDDITFKVLSMDSVLRKTEVQAGSIVTGNSFSLAVKTILNQPVITNILNYSEANINVNYDDTIDDGEFFSAINVKDALDQLMIASHSILLIDLNDNIIVKPRTETANEFTLYGRGDKYGRENIIKIDQSNDGRQRAFNSIVVNDFEQKDDNWIADYGYKSKNISIDFITGRSKSEAVALNILNQVKVPKPELSVRCFTKDVRNIQLLDMVKIDYDYMVRPAEGDILPMTGQVQTGTAKTAKTFGSFRLLQNVKFKVIRIQENPSNLTTVLKLRQAGTTVKDGYF